MAPTLPGTLMGAAPAAPALPEVGESIGRYVVLERLGAGGMGVVFAAYDPELDRKVAVKLLHWGEPRQSGDRSGSGGRRSRLLEEARALAKLSHPNIVAVHDAGVHEGRVFVAMEYIAGKTLCAWQRDAKPAVAAIVDVYRKAAEGLAAAHRAGIVHRDFKPDNVMIDAEGRVRVLDFGLARSDGPDYEVQAADGLVGTPAYMAPEQFAGESGDARSDQFSFAVSLYEALFGERPFVGNTVAELAMSTLEGKKRAPPNTADIPDHVLDIFGRGLAVGPKERFESMDALLRALEGPEPRSRRGWVRTAAASLLGAGLVASVWFATGRDERACARSDFSPVAWSDTQRAEAKARAEGSLSEAAGPAIDLTMRSLDRYASAIASGRGEVCVADAKEASASTSAQMRCFERRETVLGKTVELFMDDPSLIDRHGPEMVANLPDPEDCLGSGDALNDHRDLEAHVAALDSLEAELDLIRVLLATGKVDEARPRLAAAGELVADPELSGSLARVELLRAYLAKLDGDRTARRDAAEGAFSKGLARGQYTIAVEAALMLAHHFGFEENELRQGRFWLDTAQSLIDQRGARTSLLLEARITHGTIDYAEGEYSNAIEHYRSAVELCDATYPDQAFRCAKPRAHLGDALREHGDFADAAQVYRDARDAHLARFGEDNPNTPVLATNLGMTLLALGDNDAALAELREALRLAERIQGEDNPDIVPYIGNLGDALLRQGHYDEAQEHVTRAEQMIERHYGADHPLMAYLLLSRADLSLALRQYTAAHQAATRALQIRRAKLGAVHTLHINPLLLQADASAASGDFEAAYDSFKAALEMIEEVSAADARHVDSERHLCVAGMVEALVELRRVDEASTLAMTLPEPGTVDEPYLAGRVAFARARVARSPEGRHELLVRARQHLERGTEPRTVALAERIEALGR